MQQAQLQYANDSLIDAIPTFDGTVDKYFEPILKLESIVVGTNEIQKSPSASDPYLQTQAAIK